MYIHIEVILRYGYIVIDSLKDFRKKVIREIENLTAMNVESVGVVAKGIHVEEKES